MEYKDYYKIMGVARTASADEIKRAHRKLARQYHPDVSKEKDAELRFKELSEAYDVLRHPEKRAAYDALGSRWRPGQDFRPPPEWTAGEEFSGRGFESAFGGGRAADGADFSDFFETLFRTSLAQGAHRAPGSRSGSAHAADRSANTAGTASRRRHVFSTNGEDHHAKILIDLKEAYQGASKTLNLRIPQVDAQGRHVENEHLVRFEIPKGIRAGQHIRLAGQGSPGLGEGRPGDLYLEVAFSPRSADKPNYRVDKHDVFLDLPITPWEAALGAEIQAPTPTGRVEVKIAPGSTSGRKLRLKGRGIPGSTPGDFYFVLQVVVPPADTPQTRAFYQEMAGQFKSFSPRSSLA